MKKGGKITNTTQQRGQTPPAARGGKLVHNAVTLDAKNPIPIEYGSQAFTAMSGGEYIPYLYPKDNFFEMLLEARLLSTTQNACVNTKTNYCVGEGIVITNLKEGKTDKQYDEFFKYMNNRRENGNAVLKRVFDGFFGMGNQPIEIVRFKIKDKKFLYVYPKNQQDCRLSWPDKNDEVKSVIISKQFRRGKYYFTLNSSNSKVIPLYKRGPGKKDAYWLKDGNVERTMLWIKNEVTGYDHYGLPSSISSLPYQKLEYDAVRFNLDNIENNMIIGGAIFLTGSLQQTEADKIATRIIKQHSGHGKVGRVAVYASEQGITDAKYVSYDTHKDGSYIEMDDKVMEKILLANEWDPLLAGLQKQSTMGKGGSMLAEAYFQKLQTVIRPAQKKILEEYWEPLMEIADEWFGTNWSTEHKFDIKPAAIISSNSDLLNTLDGVEAFLAIVDAIACGAYPLEAAKKFVMARFGLTEQEATEQLGNIKVDPNVRIKSTQTKGTDKSSGGTA